MGPALNARKEAQAGQFARTTVSLGCAFDQTNVSGIVPEQMCAIPSKSVSLSPSAGLTINFSLGHFFRAGPAIILLGYIFHVQV